MIRNAWADEAEALAELAASTFQFACPPHLAEDDINDFVATNLSVDRFDEYLHDLTRQILVAEDEGQLVGYCMLVSGEPVDAHVAELVDLRPCVELSKFYVLPTHHGRGFATSLMQHALQAASDREARIVWLGVNAFNARAQRFYARTGFTMIGDRDFEVGGHTEHDYVLEYVYS